MPYEAILYEKKDRIATVTLNRPELLNSSEAPGMAKDMRAVFDEMAQDDEVLVTILTGAGRAFCSGHNMRDPNRNTLNRDLRAATVQRVPVNNALRHPIWDYPKPLIGAINGPAYGGGLNYVLSCDIIIASTEARFCFPQARLSGVPGWPGAQTLALFVGKAKASEMAMMARPIDGEDAYRWGLANKVVAPDQLMDEANAWARELAGLAPISTRLIKEDLRDSWEAHFNRSANRLRHDTARLSEDRVEGHRAWGEKRAPVFKGR